MVAKPHCRGPRLAGAYVLALAWAALSFAAACSALGVGAPGPQVGESASLAFEEARSWSRSKDPLARDRARAALRRAVSSEPDWIAPRRMLDILDTEDLLGIEALAAHRATLAERPEDAVELYLAGRLEGLAGGARFVSAARLAPGLSWAHHGLSWLASARGDWASAVQHARHAIELARDGYERSYFTSMLARYLVAADEPEQALALLRGRLAVEEVAAVDWIWLSVQTALVELGSAALEFSSGRRRALELLRESDLTDEEVTDLVRALRIFQPGEAESLELQLALAARPGAARDRARAQILLDRRPSPLALGLLLRGTPAPGELVSVGPLFRAARFAAGQFRVATEEWLGDAPSAVLDSQGLPRDATLRRVVGAARALGGPPTPEQLLELGDACLDAGWFREARAVAATLAIEDLDRALALEDRAAACQQLLADIQRTVDVLPDFASRLRTASDTGAVKAAAPPSSLDELLARIADHVARAHAVIGGETDEARVRAALEKSPRVGYAGMAEVVHPGPHFSAADEAAGLGREGQAVPGLAALFDGLGRFGLFGEMAGSAPDGTVLARVLVEERRGDHLGVPWHGAIAWCEGADLKSQAGRMGAEISGAALHEGYWVDIDTVRRERTPWLEFEARFFDVGDDERIERAVASRGLELVTPRSERDARRRERRDASILLGQADRLRLAVIADRRRERGAGRGVTLDELLEATSVHEEGHLCDRTRFLPLSENLWRALRLFAREGFSPQAVARQLEYRAQLIALCDVSDPRVPLASVLHASETGGASLTPHAEAYRELLVDLLAVFDDALEREPGNWPEIDPDHVLAHQLHLLSPDALRRLARELARAEGLFER